MFDMYKVCIDPGHNEIGADLGASNGDLIEQVLTLKIAGKVKAGLEFQGQFDVIMTREGETVNGPSTTLIDSLRTRCRIANEANVDLFVSIHINAGGGTGSEVLIYGEGGKAEQCANIMAPLIAEAGDWTNRGVKVQNIQVLRDTNMPAILTENGFIDNAQDHQKLQQELWLDLIAEAHVMGICSYFGVSYKSSQTAAPEITNTAASLPSLIVYYGDVEQRVVPFLQEKIKAPAIALEILTAEVAGAAKRIYGVGGTEEKYIVAGEKIPLYKHYAGADRIETAAAVIQAIETGNL